ncbi:MAG TPA: hypothetical protein VKR81_14375 [Candidatus Binatia bacterium]|jgi:hypothetical protein|nr:hypothetical protein [Candidatus Binatia bacterium]
MTESMKKCMVCAKTVAVLKGGICEACQDRIRREAMGEQARVREGADRELNRQGVTPVKK